MKRIDVWILLIIAISLNACSTSRTGYANGKWMGQYMWVDSRAKNFGYERMQFTMDFYPSLRRFVATHGMPDFICPFMDDDQHEAITLYYIPTNGVYTFSTRDDHSDSLYLKFERLMNQGEKAIFEQLVRDQFKNPIMPNQSVGQLPP